MQSATTAFPRTHAAESGHTPGGGDLGNAAAFGELFQQPK